MVSLEGVMVEMVVPQVGERKINISIAVNLTRLIPVLLNVRTRKAARK